MKGKGVNIEKMPLIHLLNRIFKIVTHKGESICVGHNLGHWKCSIPPKSAVLRKDNWRTHFQNGDYEPEWTACNRIKKKWVPLEACLEAWQSYSNLMESRQRIEDISWIFYKIKKDSGWHSEDEDYISQRLYFTFLCCEILLMFIWLLVNIKLV